MICPRCEKEFDLPPDPFGDMMEFLYDVKIVTVGVESPCCHVDVPLPKEEVSNDPATD